MSKLSWLVLCVLILQSESWVLQRNSSLKKLTSKHFKTYIITVDPSKCQQTPQEKHCIIEYSVRYRWPHRIRYVYNWYTRSCFEIRWASYCPAVPVPTLTNNFPSEKHCLDECGGWA